MMKKWNVGKRLLSIMLASALGIVLCTGCGGSQGGSTQSGPGETAAVESTQTAASPEAASAEQEAAGKEKTGDLRKMDVVLDWYPNALHAFLYTAIERGYFADEGLDVNIRFPANDNDAIALTAAGKAEIGSVQSCSLPSMSFFPLQTKISGSPKIWRAKRSVMPERHSARLWYVPCLKKAVKIRKMWN